MLKSARWCLLVILALAVPPVAAPRPVAAQTSPAAQLVAPTGPYAVGRTAYAWTDAARDEIHTPEEDDARELLVEVWYPAGPEDGAEPGPYMEAPMADLFAQIFGVTAEQFAAVRSNAYPGAPLAGDEGAYPVLIFDPGFSAVPRQYTILLEELASQGYVVFSPSHPYVSMLTVYPDGRVVEPLNANRLATLWAPNDTTLSEFEQVWVPDVTFVLRQIERLNDGDDGDPFEGRLDLDHLGMIGHSQGARTVSEVCLHEPRCRAAANLDGTWSGLVQVTYDKPYLLALSDNGVDPFVGSYEHGLEASAGDYYVIMIPRTTHLTFQDTPFVAGVVLSQVPEEVMQQAPALLAFNLYTIAFVEKHVRGASMPLLDGPSEDFPGVFFLLREEAIPSPVEGVEPEVAETGSQRGEFEVGAADVWTYEGSAGDMIDVLALADRPANDADDAQREEYGLLDMLLVVRGPDGTVIASNDDAGQGTDAVLRSLTLPDDGTYRIEVRSWQNRTGGAYTLAIREVSG